MRRSTRSSSSRATCAYSTFSTDCGSSPICCTRLLAAAIGLRISCAMVGGQLFECWPASPSASSPSRAAPRARRPARSSARATGASRRRPCSARTGRCPSPSGRPDEPRIAGGEQVDEREEGDDAQVAHQVGVEADLGGRPPARPRQNRRVAVVRLRHGGRRGSAPGRARRSPGRGAWLPRRGAAAGVVRGATRGRDGVPGAWPTVAANRGTPRRCRRRRSRVDWCRGNAESAAGSARTARRRRGSRVGPSGYRVTQARRRLEPSARRDAGTRQCGRRGGGDDQRFIDVHGHPPACCLGAGQVGCQVSCGRIR